MKVVVTGANGYIGKHIVKELLEQNHTVYAVDFNNKGIDDRAIYLDVNIFDEKKDIYEELFCPDILIHLAWKDGFLHNSHAHMNLLSSHYKFLYGMAKSGCKNIAVMGTMHEIGYWEGAIDENTPCNPLSAYGIAKNALRQSMILLQKEIDYNLLWLRAYYIYGDDTRSSSIFAKILQAVEAGKTEFPFTTGKSKYDFIHVKELAKQIVAATTQEKVTGIINVCAGHAVSLADKVESYIKENNLNIKLQYGVYPDREYDSPAVWGDNQKITTIMHTGDK